MIIGASSGNWLVLGIGAVIAFLGVYDRLPGLDGVDEGVEGQISIRSPDVFSERPRLPLVFVLSVYAVSPWGHLFHLLKKTKCYAP